ncbi:cysteine methyltransferase [Bacterioplanes sanyensis]|uniref:Methylated-DNA--protein-cysteine methyltransferase n=1 Tax=Bacterioplanes sanyensis TaxID=1249553 RepID=A0A222FG22_9GAMM|nr:methylated-DNA--[protein]-cysteine S-methyltransferase [Bacterioplanes sanyensis]ASP37689.1 cysteine methyltransferase [Bacterioplanes sanyensis]
MMRYRHWASPLGQITLQADDQGITGIWFEQHTSKPAELGEYCSGDALLSTACQQLQQYFTGERQQFDVPLSFHGTEFQRKVWSALCRIPFAQTCSYQQLAQHIGKPNASRAVGAANGKNPISIIVPCHRVIGANGRLTGYAGGIARKQHLLTLEQGDLFSRSTGKMLTPITTRAVLYRNSKIN